MRCYSAVERMQEKCQGSAAAGFGEEGVAAERDDSCLQ